MLQTVNSQIEKIWGFAVFLNVKTTIKEMCSCFKLTNLW